MALFDTQEGIAQELLKALLFGQQGQQGQQGVNLNQAVQDQAVTNDLKTRRVLEALTGSPITRRSLSGTSIDPVTGESAVPSGPNNLGTFYANNPNVRPGEFDPTGELALARGAQSRRIEQNEQDALEAASQQALQQAQGGLAAPEIFGPPAEAAQGNQNPAAVGQGTNPEVEALRDQVSQMARVLEAFMSPSTPQTPAVPEVFGPPIEAANIQQTAPQPAANRPVDPFSQTAIDAGSLEGMEVPVPQPPVFNQRAFLQGLARPTAPPVPATATNIFGLFDTGGGFGQPLQNPFLPDRMRAIQQRVDPFFLQGPVSPLVRR